MRLLPIKVYDVIVFLNPEENAQQKYLIKRVSKMNGDKYYVLGDNSNESRDSRHFGWVDKKLVIGKMIEKLTTRKDI